MNTKEYIMKRLTNLLYVLPFAICISCSNSERNEGYVNNYNNPAIPINVKVEGITWQEAAITRAADEIKKTIIPVNDELEIVATVEPDYEATAKTRAKTTLTAGATYRVIAYEQGGAGNAAKYIKHADFTVGTTLAEPFTLPRGCSYDIVCYSNNEAGALGAFDEETFEFSYAAGKMPLYCKTTLTIPENAETTALNITFKHVDSTVRVVVNNQTDNLSMTEVSGVTIGAHYNKMKVKLSDGHRNNPGGTPSSLPITMNTPTSGNELCESTSEISIFSHNEDPANSVKVGTLKLEKGGQEYIISDKTINVPNWVSGYKYKVEFKFTTPERTLTVSAVQESPNGAIELSDVITIKGSNQSGGTVTYNTSGTTMTFKGKLGDYVTASYEYKEGHDGLRKRIFFSKWEVDKKNTGAWTEISTDPDEKILLKTSKETNGYKYRARFIPDNRIIHYKWKVQGIRIPGSYPPVYTYEGEMTCKAYEILPIFFIFNGNTLPGQHLLVVGSKLKDGWKLRYQDSIWAGKSIGMNDTCFASFDELPGTETSGRVHEMRLYVSPAAVGGKFINPPANVAEWEDYDTWVNNNNKN